MKKLLCCVILSLLLISLNIVGSENPMCGIPVKYEICMKLVCPFDEDTITFENLSEIKFTHDTMSSGSLATAIANRLTVCLQDDKRGAIRIFSISK